MGNAFVASALMDYNFLDLLTIHDSKKIVTGTDDMFVGMHTSNNNRY